MLHSFDFQQETLKLALKHFPTKMCRRGGSRSNRRNIFTASTTVTNTLEFVLGIQNWVIFLRLSCYYLDSAHYFVFFHSTLPRSSRCSYPSSIGLASANPIDEDENEKKRWRWKKYLLRQSGIFFACYCKQIQLILYYNRHQILTVFNKRQIL